MQSDINTATYMACTIKWLDSGEIADDVVICITTMSDPPQDDLTFFHCYDIAEFMSLTNDDCGEDFQVLQFCIYCTWHE
jgi:hypothetical protein